MRGLPRGGASRRAGRALGDPAPSRAGAQPRRRGSARRGDRLPPRRRRGAASRLAKHRQGFDAVGGAITNGTPRHPVGTAGYLLEYSALLPSDELLSEQPLPHCLSYTRALLEAVGPFPEDTETGEDTLLNRRVVEHGARIGFDARIQLAHRNLTRLVPYLRHQYEHGRGLMQCVDRHDLASPVGSPGTPAPVRAWRIAAVYPGLRWRNCLRRVRRGRPELTARYLVLSPLIWAGLWATALGAWHEWRRTAA